MQKISPEGLIFHHILRIRYELLGVRFLILDTTPMDANSVTMDEPP